MGHREDRRAENEAVFRAANENLDRMAERHDNPVATYICECNRADCLDTIELSRSQYLSVREEAARFVLLPGHENAPDEKIVEANDGFVVVEKTGSGEEVARRLA